MKVALITDLHFGCRNDNHIFLNLQEKFYRECFFPKIDELGINTVINLGDTFDRRKYVNFGTLKKVKKMFFEELQKRDIWSPTLIGNHDTFYKNTNKINSVDLLLKDEFKNLTIINDPTDVDIHGFKICMIPWICDDNYNDCMNLLNKSTTDLCMGHFHINGFVMHAGQVSNDGLDREIFSRFDMVMSGHFHHRSTDGQIFYLGNPHEITWNDWNDPRGFHIFDLNTRKLEFVANPYIVHHRLIYNDKDELKDDYSQYSQTFVKIIRETRNNDKKFDYFLNLLESYNPQSVIVIDDYSDIYGEDIVIEENTNLDDALSLGYNYIEQSQDDKILIHDLKSLFHEIYIETQNLGDE